LNQRGGAWFELEQHVMENGVKNKIADISVFSGPVLDKNDKIFKKQYKKKDVQIPVEYWKVIVWKKSNGKLYAVGFLMSQWEWIKDVVKEKPGVLRAPKPKIDDDYFENIKFKNHATYQVPITEIEKATGIKFNWSNVSFPYKKRTPQKIAAKPVAKVYPTRTIREIKEIKQSKPSTALRGLSRKLDAGTVSKQRAAQLVQNGQAPLIKRFALKNIKL
jgi:endonuclease G, mitochondrial